MLGYGNSKSISVKYCTLFWLICQDIYTTIPENVAKNATILTTQAKGLDIPHVVTTENLNLQGVRSTHWLQTRQIPGRSWPAASVYGRR